MFIHRRITFIVLLFHGNELDIGVLWWQKYVDLKTEDLIVIPIYSVMHRLSTITVTRLAKVILETGRVATPNGRLSRRGQKVLARWRQCTRPSNTRFLGHSRLTVTDGTRSVQPFLHGRCHIFPKRYTLRRHITAKNCPLPWGLWTASSMVPWTHPTHRPKQHLDWVSRFATTHPRYQETYRRTERRQNPTRKNLLLYMRRGRVTIEQSCIRPCALVDLLVVLK